MAQSQKKVVMIGLTMRSMRSLGKIREVGVAIESSPRVLSSASSNAELRKLSRDVSPSFSVESVAVVDVVVCVDTPDVLTCVPSNTDLL